MLTCHIGRESLAKQSYHKRNTQEMVILCGSPGAGKSTFYRRNLAPLGYSRVNQDILKTVCHTITLLVMANILNSERSVSRSLQNY